MNHGVLGLRGVFEPNELHTKLDINMVQIWLSEIEAKPVTFWRETWLKE